MSGSGKDHSTELNFSFQQMELVWPGCGTPPTVNVVDVSADGYADNNGERVLPEAVAFGTSALLHHQHQRQQQQQQQGHEVEAQ